MNHAESNIQRACVRWFDLKYGKNFSREVIKRTRHKNNTWSTQVQKVSLLYAIPNGGNREYWTGSILKSEGVRPGVADLFLSVPKGGYSGLYMELKTDVGKQTESQKAFQELATENGYVYITIRSVDEFMETVDNYLKL